MLGRDALGRQSSCPEFIRVQRERAGTPLGHVPFEQVLMPLAHFETGPLSVRSDGVLAVGVVGVPAV